MDEKLKLQYEHAKSYAFGFFAAIIAISFGVVSNLDRLKNTSDGRLSILIIAVATIFLIIAFFAFLIVMENRYTKLIETRNN